MYNVHYLREKGGVLESATGQCSLRRERFQEFNGRHLAQVADHGRHGHVLEQSIPHLQEKEREG